MCSCHDWNILHHSPDLLNSTLNCNGIVVAVLYRNNKGIVRKAAGRLEHTFLLLGENKRRLFRTKETS